VILLDVREQEELEMEWIPGATPMPLSKFDVGKVADMGNRKIGVICFTGRRSIEAGERLVEYGIAEVYSVKDGLLAWNAAGLESVDQSALLI
jgi:rhodanese-related sulfurtransferase